MPWDAEEVYKRKKSAQRADLYLRNLPPERQEALLKKRALRTATPEERREHFLAQQREHSRKTRKVNALGVRRSRVKSELRRAYVEDRDWLITVLRELAEHGADMDTSRRAAEDPGERVGDAGEISPAAER